MEEDIDVQGRLFYNAVREYIIWLLIFILLYVTSYAIICAYRRKAESEDYYTDDYDDATVYKIAIWICTLTLAVSFGAVLLLPMSIVANEAIIVFPGSYYLQWVNGSLILGLWNITFLCSNLCLFVLLPFAYLFTESEGFPGSRKSVMSRVKETLAVLALLAVVVCGIAWVVSALLDTDTYSRKALFDIWSFYLPYLYSCISLLGVLTLLICTPVGFARMFTVTGDTIVRPQFGRNLEEELVTTTLEEDSLRRRLDALTSSQQPVTCSNGNVASSKKPTASSSKEQSFRSKDQYPSSKEQAASSKGQAASSKGQAASSKEHAASSKEQAVSSKGQAASSKDQAASSEGKAASSKGQAASSKGQAASSKEQAVTSKEQAVSSKEQAVSSKNVTEVEQMYDSCDVFRHECVECKDTHCRETCLSSANIKNTLHISDSKTKSSEVQKHYHNGGPKVEKRNVIHSGKEKATLPQTKTNSNGYKQLNGNLNGQVKHAKDDQSILKSETETKYVDSESESKCAESETEGKPAKTHMHLHHCCASSLSPSARLDPIGPTHLANGKGWNSREVEIEVLRQQLAELEIDRREIEKRQAVSSLRKNLGYPLVMVLLLALTVVSLLLVVQNTILLLVGLKALPIETKDFVLGESLSTLGPLGAMVEIILILYLMLASLVGFYSLPRLDRLKPRKHDTPMTSIIVNCATLVVLSSALPVLSRTLGITNFDLMGHFRSIEWLGNWTIILSYNLVFGVSTTVCLTTKFTAALRRELLCRFRSVFRRGGVVGNSVTTSGAASRTISVTSSNSIGESGRKG